MSLWNDIWKTDSYSNPELRRKKAKYKLDSFEKFVPIQEFNNCVDIGCGGGYISKELFKRYNCKIISIDKSYEAIELAKKYNYFEGANYFVSDAHKTNLPDSTVDIVFCIGVLEHIHEIDLVLNELQRILKPSGKIIITSSNKYSLMFCDRIIKQIFHKWKYGYQKNWSPKGLRNKLKHYDFSILDCSIIQGYGDFERINKIDKKINKIIPVWGRYIQIIGVKK